MAINWQMGVSDPMQGINSGLASLGQALQAQKAQERQANLDTMSMDLYGLEAQKSRLTLADLQRKQTQDAELRNLLATPQTIPATPGVSNISQPSPGIQGLSGLAAMGGADFTGRGAAPAPTMEDPTQGAASPSGFSMEQPQPTTGPQLGATNEGVTPGTEAKQASPERIAYKYYRANDPVKAKEYASTILTQAKDIAKAGDHAGAIQMINDVLGTKLTYLGSKDNIMSFTNPVDGTTTIYDLTTQKTMKLEGTNKPLVLTAGSVAVDPVTGKELARGTEKPEYKDRSRTEGDKTVFEQSQDGGKTWKVVSEGPRYKPDNGKGDFKIDDSNRKYSASLRKEFNNLPEIKESNSVMPKITSMHKALEESKRTNNYVAVDQALITLYNKLTDPSSVVRESEYARTAQNIPLLNNIKGKAQKILTGGAGLTSEERNALVQMADLMNQGYTEIRNNRISEYNGYAASGGVDPKSVINDDFRATPGKSGKPIPKGARPVNGPNGEKGYFLNGSVFTMDGKRIK